MRDRPLNWWVVLALVCAYVALLLDIRYDHNHVIRHHPIAWTPIVYSAVMIVAGIFTLLWWDRGRVMMLWLFSAGIVVGLLGFWLHNSGHPVAGIGKILSTWGGAHPDPMSAPPVLAPLAFAGLGLIGVLACARWFLPSPDTSGITGARSR